MQKKLIAMLGCFLALIVLCACNTTAETVEVTRIVPQTVVVTQIVQITTTPQPTNTLQPSRTPWPDSVRLTPIKIVTPTPGMLIADAKTRPDVERFISKSNIKNALAMYYAVDPFGGRTFCAYAPMGIGNDGHTIKLYLWTDCREYFVRGGKAKPGSGISGPVVLSLGVHTYYYIITDIKDAGMTYAEIETNFPPAMQDEIYLAGDVYAYNRRVAPLIAEVEQDAKAYYGN